MPDSRGRAAYRALLRLLPADMRCRFGADMEEMLVRRLAEGGTSRIGRGRVWLRAVTDVVFHAIALRRPGNRGERLTMGTLTQDIRYGFRSALSSPWTTLVAIATLAVAIGAATATFSVVDGVLLRSLPFEEPDDIVFVWPETNGNKAMTIAAAERMPSLEGASGLSTWALTLTGAGEAREISGLLVSHGYFDVLRVRPVLGRTFTAREELPGEAAVVVLSHELWVEAFGADPGVIGRTLEIGGAEYERRQVIGVMPPGVAELWREVDVWIPLEGDPALALDQDDSWYVNQRIARLAPGATIEQATREVSAFAHEVVQALPGQFAAEEALAATVQPAKSFLRQSVSSAVWVSLAAAVLVLLIGAFNVANLLVARGEGRQRDLAVRVALGAGRARLRRMLFFEAGTLALLAGGLGVATAYGLVDLLVRMAPETFPGIDDVAVSGSVLTFALLATGVAALAAGLLPAARASRPDATAALGGGTRGAAGRPARGVASLLLASQVALAVVVGVGSGLMLRSLSTLLAVDPGLDGDGVLVFKPSLPAGAYQDRATSLAFYDQVSERIAAIPGVESIGGIQLLPGTRDNWSFPTFPEGFEPPAGAPTPSVNFRAVRGEYFATTRLPVLSGRVIGDTDREDSEPVVVVNEAFVERFWPDRDAIGSSLSFFSPTGTRYRVVGVAADVHQHGREVDPRPEMYFSRYQIPWDEMSMWLLVRAGSGDALSLVPAVREAVWSIDADVPITGFEDLGEALGASTQTMRFITALLTAFGVFALGLCAVGVFGVASYTSGRRKGEFGIRLALGSSRSDVVRSALSRSLAPVAVGVAVGLAVASVASRLLGSVLYSIPTTDPWAFGGVALLLAVVGFVASVLPAWRASRVDPVAVLSLE